MRKKLIALIQTAVNGCSTYWAGLIADYLIANGVTFATDNHVGGKWIPVTERLPERFETVLVCLDDNTRSIAYLAEGDVWIAMWVLSGVTHWMPLPNAPKEGE